MDNHPIPQDVTGFKFRLIGDMTVKQFGYVAVGGIFAVIFMYAPISVFLRVPLMLLSGGLGAALAFMSLEGRPLDTMVSYFVKALITPNQYAYHKNGGVLSIFAYQSNSQTVSAQGVTAQEQIEKATSARSLAREQKLQGYLQSVHSQNLSPLEKREIEFTQKLFPAPVPEKKTGFLTLPHLPIGQTATVSTSGQNANAALPPQPPPTQTPPSKQKSSAPQEQKPSVIARTPEEKNTNLSLQENVLSQELTHAKQEEQTETDAVKKQEAHIHATDVELQLQEIKAQKEALEKELQALKAHVATTQVQNTVQTQSPAVTPQAPQQPQPAVRKIPSEMAKTLGLPHLPDVPNLILGIVKDPRGNVLSNILVEVKDKDGTPARAFRTNQLGQFASATQLTPGTYEIQFEDPKGQHTFDTIQINANNEILMPIEVISHDEREELRKALFN